MFEGQAWFEYLDETMQGLVVSAYYLLDREELSGEGLSDYSFAVFPMAKAYEGFLKKYLYDIGLISEAARTSRHFRIGRSLNPALPPKFRDDKWIYDDLERACEGLTGEAEKGLPADMWKAWRQGRNRIFHYIEGKEKMLDLEEARKRVDFFRQVMERSVECQARIRIERRGKKTSN